MTRRAIPATHEGHGSQGPGKDNFARGVPKGRTFERRQRTRQDCSNEIRDRDLKEQLHLRKERRYRRFFRKTAELEVAKQIIGTPSRLSKTSDWIFDPF
jgi:hypothetical protein